MKPAWQAPRPILTATAASARSMRSAPARFCHPAEPPLSQLERPRQRSCKPAPPRESRLGYSSVGVVVQSAGPESDPLAVAAGADERGDRCGADVDHRGRLDAGEDRAAARAALRSAAERSRGAQAERERRLAHAAADPFEPGVRVRARSAAAHRGKARSRAGTVPIVPEQCDEEREAAQATGSSGSRRPCRGSSCGSSAAFAAAMPSGTPSAMLAASETNTSSRCSSREAPEILAAKSVERRLRLAGRARCIARIQHRCGFARTLLPSSSAAAFMRIILRSSIASSSFESARQASGSASARRADGASTAS